MARPFARPSTRRSSSSFAMARTPVLVPLQQYAHSPFHYAVAARDHLALSRLISTLPRLADPSQVLTEADSIHQEHLAERISAAIDRRDVPANETPIHLAIRLDDAHAVRALAEAGADVSLQNSAGWGALQEALCRGSYDIKRSLTQIYRRSAWAKWRRRMPRLVAVLHRMRDFYMEMSFHFESSIIPFIDRIAPSDTYKIWKRNGDLRADTSISGFDGMKIQRVNQSFLFLADGSFDSDHMRHIPPGSLLVLNHDERVIFDAFENADKPLSESDISDICNQTSVYRPGVDVTGAELVGKMNWRKQEKTERVGPWKARKFDVHNVNFSVRTRRISMEVAGSEQVLPLELDEDDDGFLVADISNPRRHSSFVREERDFTVTPRKSVAGRETSAMVFDEKETVKSLRPSVWLTEQFPLKIHELLPLLDILSNRVKAVRRLRELLTTKLPPSTFPVKVAIPVVPMVKVVITFTKFLYLESMERFYTPLSSPRQFVEESEESRPSSFVRSSRWRRQEPSDPLALPIDYRWTTLDDGLRKMKKSKSVKKAK